MLRTIIQKNIDQKSTAHEQKVNILIEKVLVEHKYFINKIDNLLPSEQDRSYTLFIELLKRYIRKVYDISASEYHHENDKFALSKQTFQAIIDALTKQHKKIELLYNSKGHLDSQKKRNK